MTQATKLQQCHRPAPQFPHTAIFSTAEEQETALRVPVSGASQGSSSSTDPDI